jgi:hypothetical protein
MTGRRARVVLSVLLFTLVLTAAGACGRKAKPEPLRSAAVVFDRSDRILGSR